MLSTAAEFFCALCVTSQSEVGWDEVVATAREQLGNITTMRVKWRITRSDTEQLLLYERSSTDALKSESTSNSGMSEELKALLLKEVQLREKGALRPLNERTITTEEDFWTDRKNFQIRGVPFASLNAVPVFPDALSFPDELLQHFKQTSVLSYGPATNDLFRRWDGKIMLGSSTGAVAVAKAYEPTMIHFPPYCAWNGNWPGTRLAIDLWMSDNAITSEVLGSAVIQERSCLVVRRTFEKATFPEENIANVGILAWVDMERGAIPLRLEFYRSLKSMADVLPRRVTPSDYRKPMPFLVMRDLVVEEVKSGLWYPTQGIEELIGPEQYINNTTSDVYGVPHRLTTWTAQLVETERFMPEEMFALRFPDETVFVSQPTGDVRVVGDANEFGKRAVTKAKTSSTPTGHHWSSLLWGALACLAISAGLAFWRFRSRLR
jgi:hypothetical protein